MRAVYFGRLPITASGPTEAFPEAFQKSAFQSDAFQSASAGESTSYELDASWFPNHQRAGRGRRRDIPHKGN
jgi:hypothetical protein